MTDTLDDGTTRRPRVTRRGWVLAALLVAILAVIAGAVLVAGTSDGAGEPAAAPSPQPDPQPTGADPSPPDAGSEDDPDGESPPEVVVLPVDDPADRAFLRQTRHELRTLPAEFPVVRGVYTTKHSFWGERWNTLMDLIRTTELNALVVDVKDDRGELLFHVDHLPLAVESGAATWQSSRDPRPRLRQLRALGGYPIARVVCFKDSYVARHRPDLAVIDTRTGEPWMGRDGQLWLNPYQEEAWRHCIEVGKAAARMGFLEIQFDYMRFPNAGDGPSQYFSFSGVPADRPREQWRHPEAITRFLATAREELHAVGARVSADVFGLTTYNWSWDGDGTGQVWEQLAAEVDYLSPMVYPSHYYPGNYGLANPEAHPYEVVAGAMREARQRTEGLRAKLRPWLEDFSLGVPHSPQRVLDQKRGVYEHGIEGWLLWNAGNRYSVDALEGELRLRSTPFAPPPRTREPNPPPGTTVDDEQGGTDGEAPGDTGGDTPDGADEV